MSCTSGKAISAYAASARGDFSILTQGFECDQKRAILAVVALLGTSIVVAIVLSHTFWRDRIEAVRKLAREQGELVETLEERRRRLQVRRARRASQFQTALRIVSRGAQQREKHPQSLDPAAPASGSVPSTLRSTSFQVGPAVFNPASARRFMI